MPAVGISCDLHGDRLKAAKAGAELLAKSKEYQEFVEFVRTQTPWRFKPAQGPRDVNGLEVFLRGVDHHLLHFVPKLLVCLDREIRTIFDFGCGSGGSAIALAMVFPEAHCRGVDISATDVSIARKRAELYGVADRCRFESIDEGQALPVASDQFDLCTCCSVLEYITDPETRKSCVQEMARVVAPGGMLFMTVPNGIYPVELHTRKLGWNYFPKLLKARVVGSSASEVKRLAAPHVLKLHNTPLQQLFRPWTNFCLEKTGTD